MLGCGATIEENIPLSKRGGAKVKSWEDFTRPRTTRSLSSRPSRTCPRQPPEGFAFIPPLVRGNILPREQRQMASSSNDNDKDDNCGRQSDYDVSDFLIAQGTCGNVALDLATLGRHPA